MLNKITTIQLFEQNKIREFRPIKEIEQNIAFFESFPQYENYCLKIPAYNAFVSLANTCDFIIIRYTDVLMIYNCEKDLLLINVDNIMTKVDFQDNSLLMLAIIEFINSHDEVDTIGMSN